MNLTLSTKFIKEMWSTTEIFRDPIRDFYENLRVTVLSIKAATITNDIRNLSPTSVSTAVNDEVKKAGSATVSSYKIYACMLFMGHIIFSIANALIYELSFTTLKWILIWCCVSLFWEAGTFFVQNNFIKNVATMTPVPPPSSEIKQD